MVRRLVKQHDVRVREEQRGERDAHLPAAGEFGGEPFGVTLRSEAQTLEHLLGLDLEAKAALGFEQPLQPLMLGEQPLHRRVVFAEQRHPLFTGGKLA